jgi:hypothetical protein
MISPKSPLFSLLGFCVISGTAEAANLVVNGSMNSTDPFLSVNNHNDTVADSWTAVGITTPDTFSPATSFFFYTYAPNNNSGQFTHLSAIGGTYNEGIEQTITGAVIGTTYSLQLDQAVDLSFGGTPGGGYNGWFDIVVAGNTFSTTSMAIPLTTGALATWQRQSFSFVAPSVTFSLVVSAMTDVAGRRVDMGLDNVSIEALPPVPEPMSGGLLSLAALAMLQRRRR